jgi:hypothetical protein
MAEKQEIPAIYIIIENFSLIHCVPSSVGSYMVCHHIPASEPLAKAIVSWL